MTDQLMPGSVVARPSPQPPTLSAVAFGACASHAVTAAATVAIAAVTPAVGGVRGGGAGVGGGVHDGGEDFVLVGGGADFEVVEAASFVVEEDALAVAEVFFGRFGAVLFEGVDPVVGDAGEEVVPAASSSGAELVEESSSASAAFRLDVASGGDVSSVVAAATDSEPFVPGPGVGKPESAAAPPSDAS
ncbi:UNVERIFIED_ORG: hypothetical protein J2X79_000849 [Arthrobacter globiformis]|nr:hypothetical protein [Arthrobacter globiformis]